MLSLYRGRATMKQFNGGGCVIKMPVILLRRCWLRQASTARSYIVRIFGVKLGCGTE